MKKLILLCLVLLLSGCVDKEILDDINIEVGVGYDLADDLKDKYRGTVLFQEFQPDKSVINRTFSGSGKLRQDLLLEVTKQSSEPVVTGGLKLAVFGPELSKKGIYDLVDSFQRDASIGARVFVATSEGKAEDMLNGEYGTRGNSTYIYNLIQHNIEHRDIPKTNLHILANDYYQEGKDPFLPRLKKLDDDKVEIAGISLFSKDREVEVLPVKDMFFFKLLVDKYSEGNFDVKLKKDELAAVKSLRSKHKIKITDHHASITINIEGIIREYTGDKLASEVVGAVQKKLEKKVEKECLRLLKQFQELGIDPIGLGQMKKSKHRNFDFKKWEDDYKTLSFDVKCNVTIEETGVIE
ncbi:Ger(x)C family spore germination protein [Cytobacillus sp. FSL W8-0315]|uniref:Ger(x)C family spore germination protein n=1 Tax=Cytobacillus TaxID=2675230 RepID=UPI002042139F|nr:MULTISPECIES: Ger(x)C family spore germination protein [Cytobacillus]MBY0159081.1 Ger(x)C family spore germination protein [Cytobacillus firmus]MCM3393539.1 Ger(x)C family spore germination protein [Cytobacillus oceanisediminis]MCS0826284.1 Ger(x)C family spore germination protein [Cytobacillus firmus]UQX53947.1 Ger(x)C family spore germination protein [Cytobacillus pseudoceanisediminis]